jgi:CRP/FNR family transcriptional regulator
MTASNHGLDNDSWIERFSGLHLLETPARDLLRTRAQVATLPNGTTIFAPGAPAQNFLLVLDGVVKVHQTSVGGREIVLYRVSGGESCIMTTACLLSEEVYGAEGTTETEVEAVVLPKAAFNELLASSPTFRRFVFSDYSHRITDILHLVEDVAFERMDRRLAEKLLEREARAGGLRITHQDLAAELGSAREVISRQLKEFQRRGWIAAGRGQIEITNRSALEALAGDPSR